MTQPPTDLVPELPRPLGETSQHDGAIELAGQLAKLLVLRDAPLASGDRAVTVADRDHAHLVGASLRPDLGAPLLRVEAVWRADLATAQKLRIVAARPLEVILDDPAKPLVMLRVVFALYWHLAKASSTSRDGVARPARIALSSLFNSS